MTTGNITEASRRRSDTLGRHGDDDLAVGLDFEAEVFAAELVRRIKKSYVSIVGLELSCHGFGWDQLGTAELAEAAVAAEAENGMQAGFVYWCTGNSEVEV
ncbi:hypothetical protein F0562_003646 [Nyssa sinensis]|uniref:Uncharacterized protein n=1 Tax=Nyssa sinensis TaxID=561372 RepID=A0A5J5BWH7_9ASTE|nr:hypothetical protein F0562_003646 [Nyssa sinensis]